MFRIPKITWVLSSIVFIAVLATPAVFSTPAAAVSTGAPAPAFELPWLGGQGRISSGDLWPGRDLTVLVIWNRSCPHCTEVALGMDSLADSLEPMGMTAVGILFGPDDPEALEEMLWDHEVNVPHLWDARGTAAAAYGLGVQNLGVFLVDRRGIVQARFDQRIDDLRTSALPAAREWMASRSGGARSQAATASSSSSTASWNSAPSTLLPGLARISLDARARILTTEGVRLGDVGLYREELEPGSLFLHRWDLRLHWSPVEWMEVVPWLRLSNEEEEVLEEGPEQISDPRGSLSLHARSGRLSGTLGAFPLVVSPLMLQRWDDQDAPPLGGVSGCAVCGSGASGIRQNSLEILEPEYVFEGLQSAYAHKLGRLQGWFAVPRWERKVLNNAPLEERAEARYRRLLYGTALDLGRMSDVEAETGLSRPIGLRLAYLWIEDDRRTVPKGPLYFQPQEQDEQGWVVSAAAGPFAGLRLEGELTRWWRVRRGQETEAGAHRVGARGKWEMGRSSVWFRVHHLRTDEQYAPYYRALTYDANREGWRVAGGWSLQEQDGMGRNLLEASLFLRTVEEVEALTYPSLGKVKELTAGLSLVNRPWRDLAVGTHLVRIETDNPCPCEGPTPPSVHDQEGTGVSLDLQWEGVPAVEPLIRVDWIQRDDGGDQTRDYWQGFVSVRVVL